MVTRSVSTHGLSKGAPPTRIRSPAGPSGRHPRSVRQQRTNEPNVINAIYPRAGPPRRRQAEWPARRCGTPLRTAPQWRLSGSSPTTVTPRVIQSDTDVDTALLYWARGRHRRHARGEATRGSSTPDTPDLAVTAAAPQQELGEPHRSTLFATG